MLEYHFNEIAERQVLANGQLPTPELEKQGDRYPNARAYNTSSVLLDPYLPCLSSGASDIWIARYRRCGPLSRNCPSSTATMTDQTPKRSQNDQEQPPYISGLEGAVRQMSLELRAIRRELGHLRLDLDLDAGPEKHTTGSSLDVLTSKMWGIVKEGESATRVEIGVQTDLESGSVAPDLPTKDARSMIDAAVMTDQGVVKFDVDLPVTTRPVDFAFVTPSRIAAPPHTGRKIRTMPGSKRVVSSQVDFSSVAAVAAADISAQPPAMTSSAPPAAALGQEAPTENTGMGTIGAKRDIWNFWRGGNEEDDEEESVAGGAHGEEQDDEDGDGQGAETIATPNTRRQGVFQHCKVLVDLKYTVPHNECNHKSKQPQCDVSQYYAERRCIIHGREVEEHSRDWAVRVADFLPVFGEVANMKDSLVVIARMPESERDVLGGEHQTGSDGGHG
ncbi:hypothetical protein PENSPDRAFT_671335 [Peniophora sp. CONT]|nr:hypothetical protein PENSPDRAFT_671335 [Peniophora sp. CONT]